MKKRGLLLTTLLAVLLLLPQTLQAAAPVKLWIHGKDVVSDVSPFIENNRTLVPLRVITENLGYEVTWDGAARKVSVNKDDLSATLTIGSGEVAVNKDGKKTSVTIEVPAKIKNNRTFVPLRAIGELFGEDVDWDKDNRTAIVGEGYTPKANPASNQLSLLIDGKHAGKINVLREKGKTFVDVGELNKKLVEYTSDFDVSDEELRFFYQDIDTFARTDFDNNRQWLFFCWPGFSIYLSMYDMDENKIYDVSAEDDEDATEQEPPVTPYARPIVKNGVFYMDIDSLCDFVFSVKHTIKGNTLSIRHVK